MHPERPPISLLHQGCGSLNPDPHDSGTWARYWLYDEESPRWNEIQETKVAQSATARQAHSALGITARRYGTDSPEAGRARRAFRTARLCSQILAVREQLDGFAAVERNAILAAMDGREVNPSE